MRPIALLIAAAALLPACRRSDPALVRKIRAEVDAWHEKRPAIAPVENGAVLVLRGAEALGRLPAPLWREDAAEGAIEAYLEANAEALADVRQGLARERFEYCDDVKKGATAKFPPLLPMRTAGRALLLRARLHRARGETAEACEDLRLAAALGVSLSREPQMISAMIGLACESSALEAVLAWLQEDPPAAEHLRTLGRGLAALHARRGSFRDMIEGEVYVMLIELAKLADGRAPPFSRLRHEYETLQVFRGIFDGLDPRRFFEAPEDVRRGDIGERLGIRGSTRGYLVAGLPGLARAFLAAAEREALWRGAVVALALHVHGEETGALPRDLDALAGLPDGDWTPDPFTGKPLVYRAAEEGFFLYSAGADGRDDGGGATPVFAKDGSGTPADLVYARPR